MYGQPLLFFNRDVCTGIRDDRHRSNLVHQAVLTFHIIGFLLVEFTEFFAGKVGLTRTIHVDMYTYALVTAGHDQRTAV